LKKVLSLSSYAQPRWYVFHNGNNETIAVDTITFISELEDVVTYRIYTAKVWIKYIVKTRDAAVPFKMSLENVEIKFKFVNNAMGIAGEYRILEFYGYYWDDKENYYTKFENASWETVVPDSSKETNLIKIIKYDLERQKESDLFGALIVELRGLDWLGIK